MFLATTALSDFWDPQDETLFLGSWCLLHRRRSEWAHLRHRVLACPWNDRDRYYAAVADADRIYEQLLPALSAHLNDVHGLTYPTRAWRVLVGPWLWHFVHIVYDRHVHLTDALAAEPGLRTVVVAPDAVRASRDASDLIGLVAGDAYNLQLCSDLFRVLGFDFPERALTDEQVPVMPAAVPAASVLRRLLHTALAVFRTPGHIALCEMYMPQRAVWAIALKSGMRALPYHLSGEAWPSTSSLVSEGRRRGLSELPVTGEIARAVLSLLPRHFPTLYLEGFLQARREVAAEERGLPAATVSLTAWLFNERFKFLAAEAAAEGRVLITAQHGGNYGISRYLSAERHERSIADRFMVWGWATDETPDCRNVPNPKLAQLRQMRRRATTRGDVLFVATAHQRYLYRFHSQPVGTQFAEYVEWQQRFFRALPSSRHHAVVLRPSATDHGHGITDRIRTNFPEVRIDRRPTFDEQLSSAGLVVVDHCATTYLQSLAVNAPTVVFWDPQRWELRPEAEPFFEMLREVGILWDAPEEAARQVDAVYGDPHAWWRSDRVQKVRRTFVKRYALDSDDWASRWVEALSAEVSRDSRTVGVVQKP